MVLTANAPEEEESNTLVSSAMEEERGGEEDVTSIVVESYVASGSVAILNDSEEALEDSDDALDDSDSPNDETAAEEEVTSLLLSLDVEVGAIKGALEVVTSRVDSVLLELELELVTASEELEGDSEDDKGVKELSWLLSRVEDEAEADEEGIVDDSLSLEEDNDDDEDSLNVTVARLLEAVLEAVLEVSSLLDEVV